MTKTKDAIDGLMADMTRRAVEAIETGMADPHGWIAPWHNATGGAVNAVTGRRYTGGNFVWLMLLGAGPWATFRQWKSIGAFVREGERGTLILVPKPVKFDKEREDGTKETVAFTRFTTAHVFHAGQVDGWQAPAVPTPTGERNADADALIAAWSAVVPIRYVAGNRAFYSPLEDTITVPPFEQYKDANGYYATTLHEAGHSTGHASRLDRGKGNMFGSPEYAREELVAELTSAFLGQHYGIRTDRVTGHGEDQHHAYLASWLKALKNDTSYLWAASMDAGRAARMLLEAVPA